MTNALVMVGLAAWAAAPVQHAVDPAVPVAQRVAAIDALTATPRREDFAALRPLKDTEDPALLAAYLRFLAVVPEPESLAVAREVYVRAADVKTRARAVEAMQPKLHAAPADLVPFFFSVLTGETSPESDPIHLTALRKLAEVNTPSAALAVLRFEPQSEAAMLGKLDALTLLRESAPAKIASFARQHARSPKPKVAQKASALVTAMKVRR